MVRPERLPHIMSGKALTHNANFAKYTSAGIDVLRGLVSLIDWGFLKV